MLNQSKKRPEGCGTKVYILDPRLLFYNISNIDFPSFSYTSNALILPQYRSFPFYILFVITTSSTRYRFYVFCFSMCYFKRVFLLGSLHWKYIYRSYLQSTFRRPKKILLLLGKWHLMRHNMTLSWLLNGIYTHIYVVENRISSLCVLLKHFKDFRKSAAPHK